MVLVCCRHTDGLGDWNVTQDEDLHYSEINVFGYANGFSTTPLMVGLTLMGGAAAKGAVCLDGTLPAYHIHRGYGSGANSWLIDLELEGGGWCDTIRNCVYRKKTSSRFISIYGEKQIPFRGILSNKASEIPGIKIYLSHWFLTPRGRNGLFINSCFAHCQTERQDTWFAQDSPHIGNKGVAKSVGNWYFDRVKIKAIDCPYPCDRSCHDLVFK